MGATTISNFKRAWYASKVSHDPNFDRDKTAKQWRNTVMTARTWRQIADRTTGKWQTAAVNQCLPSQV